MIVRKTLSLRSIYEFAGHHLLWLTIWMSLVTCLYYLTGWKLMGVPWLPLSLIGTAVAFYVGFKNNQSYDRVWEARKIWGGMVNNSRMLGSAIRRYRSEEIGTDAGEGLRKQFIYRHIAYLYQLREQLLKPSQWEHVSLSWIFGRFNRRRHEGLFGRFKKELDEIGQSSYLSSEEETALQNFKNKAVHLLDRQTELVQTMVDQKMINTMQQIQIQEVLNGFYEEQGKAERIKNFPFPRKYASFSFVFVCIFVFLLPFGLVGEFSKLGAGGIWLTIPMGVIVGWIYVVMEMIGDYSENPFEGLHNDIPMLAICRTIEIDLLQMLGENQVPAAIQAKGDILI